MRILIMRMSAMGDVALMAPVIRAMRSQYPEVELVILTRPAFTAFFPDEAGVGFINPDFRGRHKGLSGLVRLFRDIRGSGAIDHILDLHDVLRTKVLRLLFMALKVPVSVFDKDRRGKREIIHGRRGIKVKHTVERYMDVFRLAGFHLSPVSGPSILPDNISLQKAGGIIGDYPGLNIGVAPYARHPLKMWPVENMINLLGLILLKYDARFWFLGGKEEADGLDNFVKRIPGSVNLSGRISLKEELAMISKLDLMIAMDSSNMHMASLVGIKVVSIWGGTDPMTGFGAWMQPENYSIRIPADELNCRPCTIYGKGKCRRGDLACMMRLTPEMVFRKIEEAGVLEK